MILEYAEEILTLHKSLVQKRFGHSISGHQETVDLI